jgi:hypothetical protein
MTTPAPGKAWRRGKRDPGSLQTRIEVWLQDRPGLHRSADIAEGLNASAHAVANACNQMMRAGRLVRQDIPEEQRAQMPYRNGARWTGYTTPTHAAESVSGTR